MVTEEERQWMWKEYASEPGMRLNLGIRRRLAPLLDNNPQKILLADSLLFTLPGSPVLYYGDEIGMGDDITRADRDGVRSPMQWNTDKNAGFSNSDTPYAEVIQSPEYSPDKVSVAVEIAKPDSLLNSIRKMIAVRKEHPVLATGELIELPEQSPAIGAFLRQDGSETLLILHNLSGLDQKVSCDLDERSFTCALDLLSGEKRKITAGKMEIKLQPYGYYWFKLIN
jgi:maltose alpha-D-glucosyltransferase/alpha-amylase